MSNPICPKCNVVSRLTGGDEIYPHRKDLHCKHYYKCDGCGGYVGCHKGTIQALGTPADAELRKARSIVHRAIDPIWMNRKKGKKKARWRVYKFMSEKMGIPKHETHVGMFNLEQCRQAYLLMVNITYQEISDFVSSQLAEGKL